MSGALKYPQFIIGLIVIVLLTSTLIQFLQWLPFVGLETSKEEAEEIEPRGGLVHSYIPHSPITITSNADFEAQGFPGNGTVADPYVIAGLNITSSGTSVSISNTDVHFVIRDCFFSGGWLGDGISLETLTYGEIRNNTITHRGYGILLNFSTDIVITNNTIFYTGNDGLRLFLASHNTLVNNSISRGYRDGVSFQNSNYNVVVNNTMSGNSYSGMFFYNSLGNTFSSNIMVDNGVMFLGSIGAWLQNITGENLVNGKPLGYFWNLTGGIIDGTQYGQVILANCTGMTVQNGVFRNVTTGIVLGFSSYCSLINNTLSENSYDGVYLWTSSNNTVLNNTISDNPGGGVITRVSSGNTVVNNTILRNAMGLNILQFSTNSIVVNNTISDNPSGGMYILDSSNNTIKNNTIQRNSQYGIYLSSSTKNNLIYFNIIACNWDENAYDDGTGNHWNSTGVGNYWSDYDGTGVYAIPGSAGSIDYHPFMYSPECPITTTTTTTTTISTSTAPITTSPTTPSPTTITTPTGTAPPDTAMLLVFGGVSVVIVVVLIILMWRRRE